MDVNSTWEAGIKYTIPPDIDLDPTRKSRAIHLEASGKLPSLVRPLIRAYVLGYASAVAPRVLVLLINHTSRSNGNRASKGLHDADAPPRQKLLSSLLRVLRSGFDLQRLPAFCGMLVGGSTILQVPLQKLLSRCLDRTSYEYQLRLSRWISTFISAWLSLRLLQSKQTSSFAEIITHHSATDECKTRTVRYAGRTLDLTVFAVVRAVDLIVSSLWNRRKVTRTANGQWNKLDILISRLTDPVIFVVSSALIMWHWFYLPSRLPPGYNKWITTAASVDSRLITALRRMRSGEMIYGLSNGQESVLQPMCRHYNLPTSYGDPAVAIPFPCELVHMGCGPSCEKHALWRWVRSFGFAMGTYVPLTLALRLRRLWQSRRGSNNTQRRQKQLLSQLGNVLFQASLSSARSSTFLASFISLFYYGVCLCRTRLGPSILALLPADSSSPCFSKAANCTKIDGGLCVASGCSLCGWSILAEKPGRQKDVALFVAPKALATFFPRRYDKGKEWRETLCFALATSIVFPAVMEGRQESVRGVFGKVLGRVLEMDSVA